MSQVPTQPYVNQFPTLGDPIPTGRREPDFDYDPDDFDDFDAKKDMLDRCKAFLRDVDKAWDKHCGEFGFQVGDDGNIEVVALDENCRPVWGYSLSPEDCDIIHHNKS